MTIDDRYKPTLAEKKLLEVLINPNSVNLSVTELCNQAGVSRNKYYEAMKKEGFTTLVTQITMDLLKGKVSNVLNATYKYSLEEKGHQDRKMLLTMLDLYKDKTETEHSGSLELSNTAKEIENFFNKSDTT